MTQENTGPAQASGPPPQQAQPPQAPAQQYHQPYPQQPVLVVSARSPILYAIIDFFITGLGLIVQGRVLIGLLFLGITVVGGALSWIPILGWIIFLCVVVPVWIISMVMAFNTAKRWNRKHGIVT